MPHTVKYKITSLLDAEKVYSSTTDFWNDHSEYLDDVSSKREEYETDRVISKSQELAEDGLSVITTREFVDEAKYNEYMSLVMGITPSKDTTLKFEKISL